jgi:serpin B
MNHETRFCRFITLIVLAILTLQVVGCAPPITPPVPVEPDSPIDQPPPKGGAAGVKVLHSEMQRDTSPDVLPADLEELVAGNRAFAADFYQAVRDRDGNLFYSPYSLSTALAMTYAGARENTAIQMADVLHLSLPQERLPPAFNALDLELASRGSQSGGADEPQPFQLSVANSLWAQYDYPFLAEFMDLLARNYGAGLRLADFASSPEPARQEINDWVYRETQEKISDLIPEGAIDELTRLVLANAIYFKADWIQPFAKESTQDAPFTLLDGSQVQVSMMAHAKPRSLNYASGEGFQAVELPYVGDQISMVVLVPDKGRFADFEAGLDGAFLGAILSSLEPRTVDLRLPKFNFESEYDLRDTLSAMGMPDAFDADLADLSGMDGTQLLYIGNVFHKAFVAVDEKGTEAAAATAVVVQLESAIMQDIVLTVDRPFIFLIQDKPSGAILFMGRVLDPTE